MPSVRTTEHLREQHQQTLAQTAAYWQGVRVRASICRSPRRIFCRQNTIVEKE
jgi:hypothetical protein